MYLSGYVNYGKSCISLGIQCPRVTVEVFKQRLGHLGRELGLETDSEYMLKFGTKGPFFSMLNAADECSAVSCKKEFKGHNDARLLEF